MSELDLANWTRFVVLILGGVTCAGCLGVWYFGRYRGRPQAARFVGLAVLAASTSFGSYHALNHPPYWPVLVGNLIGLAISVYGVLAARRGPQP